MINGKTYYQILGVLPDAEDIVIKAAYKSLSLKYHPDKWQDDKSYATERMSEINRAYEALSDKKKREHYNKEVLKRTFSDDTDPIIDDVIIRSWNKAIQFYTDLNDIADELRKISTALEKKFRITLTESKAYENRHTLANSLKNEYLQRYFGESINVQRFGLFLIREKQRAAAKALNEAVILLGRDASEQRLINHICDNYKIKNYVYPIGEIRKEVVSAARELLSLKTSFWFPERKKAAALKLIKQLGGKVSEGVFADTVELNGQTHKLYANDIVKFCETIANSIAKNN